MSVEHASLSRSQPTKLGNSELELESRSPEDGEEEHVALCSEVLDVDRAVGGKLKRPRSGKLKRIEVAVQFYRRRFFIAWVLLAVVLVVAVGLLVQLVLMRSPRHQAWIAGLIEEVSEQSFMEHVTILSGEHARSNQTTRWANSLSSTTGINAAVYYIKERMEAFGFSVELHTFDAARGPNVVSTLKGTWRPHEFIILGAHLDDMPRTGRAPGANDNGSGAAALLAIAEALFRKGAALGRSLVLEHYVGEEQDMAGSKALADRHNERQDVVVAMLNQDMTAWHRRGDPLGLAFVRGDTVDDKLTAFCENVAQLYADARLSIHSSVIRSKRLRLSQSQCCSDHETYAEAGFAAASYLQPRGYKADSQAHSPGDLAYREGFDPLQAALTARVVLAAASHMGQMEAWPWLEDQ